MTKFFILLTLKDIILLINFIREYINDKNNFSILKQLLQKIYDLADTLNGCRQKATGNIKKPTKKKKNLKNDFLILNP